MPIFKNLLSRWWFQCLLLWFSTLVLLNITGMVGARVLDLGDGAPKTDLISLFNTPGIWLRWDAGYYLGIAGEGYINHPGSAGFFPFYPMLIYILNRITGINIVVAGVIISNLAILFSTMLLYKIARIIKDDHTYAIRSVLALLVFPTSFFYFAIYAESLYFVFALLGVYFVMKNRQSYIGSGLALGLASIARPVGWLVDTVMAVEFFRNRKFDAKSIVTLVLGGILSISGILFFVYYLYIELGTFMAIPNAQAAWPRQWQIPFITYFEGLKTLLNVSLLRGNWFLYAMNALDILFTSFAVFVIVIAFSRAKKNEFPWSLAIYSVVALLFYLSSQNELPVPLWGMSRWVASLFPIYFILGNMFDNKKIQTLYFVGSAIFLLMLTMWWTSGRWIG